MFSKAVFVAAAIAGVAAFPHEKRQGVTALISPSAPAPSGCLLTDPEMFGIAAMPVEYPIPASFAVERKKRNMFDIRQVVTQLPDAQPGVGTSTVPIITQISDAQPQAPTQTVVPITQISDAQPQAPTATVSTMMHSAITQIGDGQIQAFHATVMPITQISDAQPQAPAASTAVPVTQISDAQPQAPTSTTAPAPTTSTAAAISQQSDAQPTAGSASTTVPATAASTAPQPAVSMVACDGPGTLSLNLTAGRLLDGQGRVGYIASNFQFQFDPVVPQAGAIITAGFSICSNGSLALGGSTIFWRCLSGSFYNLYDRYWAAQCSPVNLVAVGLLQPGEGGCPA